MSDFSIPPPGPVGYLAPMKPTKTPKATGGRPLLGDAPLDARIDFRLTQEERAVLDAEAERRGVKPGTLAREILTRALRQRQRRRA